LTDGDSPLFSITRTRFRYSAFF